MARTGWSTSNFLRCGSAVVTAKPLSMACWAMTPTLGTTNRLFGIYNSASAVNRNCFELRVNASDNVQANIADGSTNAASSSSTAFSANTPFHACGTWDANRIVYLNGGGKASASTAITPSSVNRSSIGASDNSTTTLPWDSGGWIAEAAVWNVVLSDADVAALATGMSPLLMHPEALVAYWPLIGNNSPENNLRSNTATMAVQGTLSRLSHPRIFMPRRRFRLG